MRPPAASPARLFTALADDNRLAIIESLSQHGPQSITGLAQRAPVTRQAVRKHLAVLETAGLATSKRRGRERIWHLQPGRLATAYAYLDRISRHWDDAIGRLEAHLERERA